MQSSETPRRQKQIYIESIRGLAALVVVLTHFAVVFYPNAVDGSRYQAHEKWERLFWTTPLNLLVGGRFAVCVFFILSGYVLSLPYFGANARDNDHLLAAVVKRPFRLGGMVVFSEVAAVILLLSGGFFNVTASLRTFSIPHFSSLWPHELVNFKTILMDLTARMFQSGLKYDVPLWTIEIELYGSILTFGFLLLFRNSRLRFLGYFLAIVCFHHTLYIGFIIGIGIADLANTFPNLLGSLRRGFITWPLLLAGLLLGSFPYQADQWSGLQGTIYEPLGKLTFLAAGPSMPGALLVFAAIFLSPHLQNLLSHSVFAFLGRISYSVYAVHFLVLGSFSCWLFLLLNDRLGYDASCAITGLLSLIVLIPLSYLLTKYIDEPATKAANSIGTLWLNTKEPFKAK